MKNYYNNDRKNEYLKIQSTDAKNGNVKNLISVFNMTAKFEEINNKDLCDFTFDEFLALFSLNQWGTFATFKSKKTIITNYIKYCLTNNLCYESSLKDISRLSHTDIKKKSKFEIEYFKDFEDFHNTVQSLFNEGGQQFEVNISNIVSLYLLWYGFDKEEIVEIKNKDVDTVNKTVTCQNTNHTEYIDNDEVINMFMQLKNMTSCPRWNSVAQKWYYLEYKNPEYFIKSERTGKVTSTNLRIRISSLNKIINDNISMENKYANKKITDYGIRYSGLYCKIKDIEAKYNIKLEHFNVSKFNEFLNSKIPQAYSSSYDFVQNYNEWISFFYGE